MKTKNSDIAVKIFLVVVAVILVGLIISWSTGVFKDKRNDLNDGTERINNAISSMMEFDLLAYDGGSITGDLLVDLIEDKDLDYSITVVTKDSTTTKITYSKGPTPSLISTNTDKDYINPNGTFKGAVTRNDNGIITAITFTQE